MRKGLHNIIPTLQIFEVFFVLFKLSQLVNLIRKITQ
jgi:hypothetical protein